MGKGFPWQLYRRYLLGQILFFVPILSVALILAEVSSFYIAVTILLFIFVQAFWGVRVFSPLGRILDNPLSPAEEPDEWFELQEILRRAQQYSNNQESAIFETALDAIQDPVLVIDREKSLLFWNSALTGLTQRSNLKSLHLEEVFRDPDILDVFNTSISQEAVKKRNIIFRDKFNQARHFRLTVVPLARRSGAVGIFSDITDIEKTEAMRMDFIANVSHELRTPLTSMKGYAQAIVEDAKDETTKTYGQRISKSVDRLINLVNDLLDLSSLERGIELRMTEVNTREVTENVLQQLEPAREKKNQTIEWNSSVSTVRADRERLEQVLTNLIQNAIKYIPENSKVEVRWEREGGDVLLRVRDNGPGIDKEHLPRLFERFYRADKARSPDKGGTGLGLAIVKHIMQRHGGQVTVNSQLGGGTEFICRFPPKAGSGAGLGSA